MSSVQRSSVDTMSDSRVWVMMRRVHCHVNDLVANRLHQRMVSTTDRRILDALDYARICGLESVPVSTLCAMIPILLKPQTAASALTRLNDRGLVEMADCGPGLKHWRLTEQGRATRHDYGYEVEQLLRQIYGPADGLTETLLARARAAVDYMNERMVPVLEFEGGLGVDLPPVPSTDWSALRRIHFYINDLICREIEPFGVGRIERRVLDSLGYARKHEVDGGLNIGTICRLNEAVNRQVVQTSLERMVQQRWIVKNTDTSKKAGSRSRIRWDLTEKGTSIRETYKHFAQDKLHEIIDIDDNYGQELLALSWRAHHHRDSRCRPVIEHYHRLQSPARVSS